MSSQNLNRQSGTPGTTPPMMSMGIRGPGGPGGGPAGRFMRPVEKPKNAKKTIIKLIGFFKGQLHKIIITFVLVLATSSVTLVTPLLSGKAIDALDTMADMPALSGIVAMLAFVYIADAVSRFFQGFLITSISQKTVKILRKSLFDRLQKLPLHFFDAHPHGELMSRLSNDTDNIAGILGSAITQIMSIVIILTGSVIMMLRYSVIMTFFSLVSIPLVFLLTKTISKNTRKLFKEQQSELGRLNACVEETISGIHVVKAYSHEKYAVAELSEINERLRAVSTQAQIWSGYIMPIMNVINNLSFAIVAGAGGVLAVRGAITVGTIAIFINYSRQFGRPLNELASLYNSLQSALASAERVFDVLEAEAEQPDPPGAKTLQKTKGAISFKNVDFAYNEDEKVLKNVSFDIPPGSIVALVGPTGAGKTTIVNLVARFYDVTGGEILLDSENIESYSRDSLRRAFGIVLQDTYLFTGTIRENIAYGNESATDEQIISAAIASGAHTFIERLADGYSTILTESGQNLSEGQRQLLAISRAVLSDPDILILDEATSSVDTRTELKIQEAFIRLMKGRTTFMIAHRLSTIISADIIMLIQNGELTEYGSHKQLIEYGGQYKKMFDMQMGGFSIDNGS